MTVKTPRKRSVKKAEYTATIKAFNRFFTATGSTAREAVENLNVPNAKGVSVLTVSKGEVKRDKILSHSMTFKLFSQSRLMREIVLKNIGAYFDNL